MNDADQNDVSQVKSELAEAAAFLLPVAKAHVRHGKWPIEVVAWLMMVSESFGNKPGRLQ